MSLRTVTFFAISSLVALATTGSAAHAQDDALGRASFEVIPGVGVEDPPADTPDLEVQFATLRTSAKAPLVLRGGKTIVMPGLGYSLTTTTLSNTSDEDPDGFHELYLELGVIQRLAERWLLVGTLQPGLATNFDDVDSDHFRFQASALAMRETSGGGKYGIGVSASYVFGRLLPIPLVTLDWRPSSSIRVRGTLPSRLVAGYGLAKRFEIGLAGQFNGNRYMIDDPDQPMAESVEYSVGDAGLFASIKLFSSVWLTGYGGTTVFRKFDVKDDDNNTISDTDVDPAAVIRVGVELSPGR